MTVVDRPEVALVANPRRSLPLHSDVVRCTHCCAGDARGERRCQLLAGHSGSHAVMFVDAELRRTVRSWSSVAPEAWVDSQTAFQRPWASGFPATAWIAG